MRRHISIVGAAALAVAGISPVCAQSRSGPFNLRSMPGFRLSGPTYRPRGDDTEVSVQVCRLVGWAAAMPASLHFLREGSNEESQRHRDIRLGRLGLRSGENCERVGTVLPGTPRPDERITICLAYSHHRCGAGMAEQASRREGRH